MVGRRVIGRFGAAEVLAVRNVPLGLTDWYAALLLRLDDGAEVWAPAHAVRDEDGDFLRWWSC